MQADHIWNEIATRSITMQWSNMQRGNNLERAATPDTEKSFGGPLAQLLRKNNYYHFVITSYHH